ncbi:hypothetical protein LZ023_01060 [Pseudomonas silvicola]|nr:hypothetical protein LZ023_01060 [Pseudomonas silvicola]
MSTSSIYPNDAAASALYFDSVEPMGDGVTSAYGFSALSESDDLADANSVMAKDHPVVLTFADNVSADTRQAMMTSTMFSQMMADRGANKEVEAIKWHKIYSEAMFNCGWFMTDNDRSRIDTSDRKVTMDALVLEIVASVAGGNAAALLPLLTSTLGKIKDSKPLLTLFENNSKDNDRCKVTLMPCLESKAGIPVTVFAGIDCHFSRDQGGSWFWAWDLASMEVTKVATLVNFNASHYKQYETTILKKLGGNSQSYFDLID